MGSAVTKMTFLTKFGVTETPSGIPSGTGVTTEFTDMDQALLLTPSTTPPVSMFGLYKPTISSGSGGTVDATSMQGSIGTLDATGKKLIAIGVLNPVASTGDVNIATGASNGYTIPQPIKVKPGGFAYEYFAAQLTAVDATHKTLDITGTHDGDAPEIALVWG